MRKWMFTISVASLIALPGLSQAAPLDTSIVPQTFAVVQGRTPQWDEQTRSVSAIEAAQIRGRLIPFIMGVAALDLTLATFYWGVYVPMYTDADPTYDYQ